MRKPLILAALLSIGSVGAASAQAVIATDPFTGAVSGANAGIAQGAAVAGPVGAIVGAPVGFVTGAIAGTVGAVGAVVGAPAYATGYGYQPAGVSTYGSGYRVVGSVPAGYDVIDEEPLATGSTRAAYDDGYARPSRRVAYRGDGGYRRVATRRYGGYRVVAVQRGYPRSAYRGRATGRMASELGSRSGRTATYRSAGNRGMARGHDIMMHGGRNY